MVRLVFEPPVLIGECGSFGIQASLQLSNVSFAAVINSPNATVVFSHDGGLTYRGMRYPSGFSLPEWPLVHSGPNEWHDFGNISRTEPKTTRSTYFNFTAATMNTFTLNKDTLEWAQKEQPIVFRGLPFGAGDELYTRAPLRLQGGGQVTLSDGSLLHSGSVWFPSCVPACRPIIPNDNTSWRQQPEFPQNCCPGNNASTHGTSSVAFRSVDGFTWDYLSTIIDARSIASSEEGCSEHDITKLSNGHLVMICRTDAGDGEETHKSTNYVRTVSTDDGKTWSHPTYINAGSARPRLLTLQTAAGEEAATAAQEVLLMAGGRWGTAGSYARNSPAGTSWRLANRSMEPTVFLDAAVGAATDATTAGAGGAGVGAADGSVTDGGAGVDGAGPWRAHSVSYWHNRLAPPPNASVRPAHGGVDLVRGGFPRFTAAVNSTVEQSTAYTSLLPCGEGCAVLLYDVTQNGEDVFKCKPPLCHRYAVSMRMHVVE